MRGLAEATYDMTDAAFQKADKADEKLFVQFGMFPHQDKAATAKEGRPIFTEVAYIMIMVPGDKESIVHRPAWEKDYQRFPRQWAAFQNKQSQEHASGTPLKMVSFLTAAQIKELEHFNCYTVEQLAGIPDAHASKFMGVQKMKQLASDYLQSAKDTAPLTTIRAEIEKKDSELAAANEAISAQGAKIAALEAAMLKLTEKAK